MLICDRCRQEDRGNNPIKRKVVQTVDAPLGSNGWQTDAMDLCLGCTNLLMEALKTFVMDFVDQPKAGRHKSFGG